MNEVEAPFDLGTYELDNCPFCNNKAYIYGTDEDDRSLTAEINCSNCPCKMHTYLAYGSRDAPSKIKLEELIESWNNRIK